MAVAHLQKQLADLTKNRVAGFRVEAGDDLFLWTVWFSGPSGTPYHPGQYKALMTFTSDFPMKPPEFRIVSEFWHPNVYPDGRICISILHPPGVDEHNALETAMMRWTPIQTVKSVLLSIISLLSDPDSQDAGAPANVDALVQYRKDRAGFDARCRRLAQKALAELPVGFVAPPTEDAKPELPAAERGMSSLYGTDMTADYDAVDGDDGEDGAVAVGGGSAAGACAGAAVSHPFAAELQQLRSMGVGTEKTDDELLALLTKCKGEVSEVVERLM